MRYLYLGIGENLAHVGLVYKNCSSIKCYANFSYFVINVFLLCQVTYKFTIVPLSRFTGTLDMPPLRAVTNCGAVSEFDCV